MQRTNIFWRGQGMADRSPDLIYVTGHVGARALVALSSPGVVKQWEWRVRDNRTPPAVIITQPHGYFKALTLTKLLHVCVCVWMMQQRYVQTNKNGRGGNFSFTACLFILRFNEEGRESRYTVASAVLNLTFRWGTPWPFPYICMLDARHSLNPQQRLQPGSFDLQ